MHKKFEIDWTKIKGGCQSGRKVVTHNSKSDLPLSKSCSCFFKLTKKSKKFSSKLHVAPNAGLLHCSENIDCGTLVRQKGIPPIFFKICTDKAS